MAEKFDWQAEEEVIWEEAAAPEEEAVATRRRPWWLLLIVVALLLAGGVVYRQVGQQVEEAATAVEEEVRAAHKLVLSAGARNDTELFYSMLSGRDRRWTEAQEQLVADGLFLRRGAFDLQPLGIQPLTSARVSAKNEPAPLTVTLSPDLSAAEVVSRQRYAVDRGGGVTETVRLQQTAVYRRGPDRWLYSPPLPEFWGEWHTSEGDRLEVVYPERDEEIAQRLAADLDAVLDRMCRELTDIDCPADLQVRLRLDDDVDTLLAAADPETIIGSGLRLELPTPTLVGLPVDEAGYEALVRGYGANVVSAVVTEMVGYECCQHGLFYQALLDKQLSQLDLRPWPLTPAVYDQLWQIPLDEDNLNSRWSRDTLALPPERRWIHLQIYSLIDFLLQEGVPLTSLAELQRLLGSDRGYWEWRYRLTGQDEQSGSASFVAKTEWLNFVWQQSPSGQTEAPPVSLPHQDLLLSCRSNEGQGGYRYDFQEAGWSDEFELEFGVGAGGSMSFSPLPHGMGYLLNESWVDAGQHYSRLRLLLPDEEIVVRETPADDDTRQYWYATGDADPAGRYLVLGVAQDVRGFTQYQLLDLQNCDQNSCPLQSIPGRPIWSPDGSQTLMVTNQLFVQGTESGAASQQWLPRLYRGDASGQAPVELGTGMAPFWLDNRRYGYLRLNGQQQRELVVATAGDDEETVWIESSQLLAAVPAAERPDTLLIWSAQASPGEASLIAMRASMAPNQQGEKDYLFLLRREAGQMALADVSLVWQSSRRIGHDFSPDGRWLAIYEYGGDSDQTIHLLDTATGEMMMLTADRFFPMEWSADGRWLARPVSEQALLVTAPAYDYHQLIPYDFGGCGRLLSGLFWTDDE